MKPRSRITVMCFFLSASLMTSSSLIADDSVEKELKKSCKKGQGQDCLALASAYREGRNVEKNAKKAAEYYKKGCELRVSRACFEQVTASLRTS
jgi:TPR repeat protein